MNSDNEHDNSKLYAMQHDGSVVADSDIPNSQPGTVYRRGVPLFASGHGVDMNMFPSMPVKNEQPSAYAPAPVKFQTIISQKQAPPTIELPQQLVDIPLFDQSKYPEVCYTSFISQQTAESILTAIAQTCHQLDLEYTIGQGYTIDITTEMDGQLVEIRALLHRDANNPSQIRTIFENGTKNEREFLEIWKKIMKHCPIIGKEPYEDFTDSDQEDELYPGASELPVDEDMSGLFAQLINEDTKEFTKIEIAKALAKLSNCALNRRMMVQVNGFTDALRFMIQHDLEELQRYGMHILIELTKDSTLILPNMDGLPDQLMKLKQDYDEPNITTKMADTLLGQITRN